jgi:hypothetical protein
MRGHTVWSALWECLALAPTPRAVRPQARCRPRADCQRARAGITVKSSWIVAAECRRKRRLTVHGWVLRTGSAAIAVLLCTLSAGAVDATRTERFAQATADAPAAVPPAALPPPDADGFITLFNGRDLAGWTGLSEYWSVRDGTISGHQAKDTSRQTFLIFSGLKVSDFELHLKYRFASPEGNSGIQSLSGDFRLDCKVF